MRKALRYFLALLALLLTVPASARIVRAANPYVEEVPKSKILGLEYAFAFKATSRTADNVTTSSQLTNNYKDFYTANDTEKAMRVSHKLDDADEKGKLWIRWPYVGKYGGRDVDLKATVTGWGTLYNNWTSNNKNTHGSTKVYPSIHFARYNFQVDISAVSYVTIRYTFLYHGSDSAIEGFKGHGTLTDLDGQQMFGVKDSYHVDKLWIRAGNTHLSSSTDGDVYLVTSKNEEAENDSEKAMVTVLYDNNFSLRFYSGVQDDSLSYEYDPDKSIRIGAVSYYNFSPKALGAIELPSPRKRVGKTGVDFADANSKADASEGFRASVSGEGDVFFDYVIAQDVTPNDISAFQVTDTLNSCLIFQSASVTDEEGTSRTGWFDIETSGQKVTFTAKQENRETVNFSNNHTYYFRIRVKLDWVKMFAKPSGVKKTGEFYYIPNKAAVTIHVGNSGVNKDSEETNQVWAVVPDLKVELEIRKRVKASELEFASGNPAFLFRAEGKLLLGGTRVLYKTVQFEPEYVKTHTDGDGYVTLAVSFPKLDWGTYTVSEQIAGPDFRFAGISQLAGAQTPASGKESVTFVLNSANQKGSATFTNRVIPGPFTPLRTNRLKVKLEQ